MKLYRTAFSNVQMRRLECLHYELQYFTYVSGDVASIVAHYVKTL
ncbi:MAG: hypothetical protein Q4B26_04720 [Eubacteriales bacterium]|nr:hypothetical protein [Eubacteriales bacterium]